MINIETGRIVDMLESREAAEVAAWLATFPNIEVFSRDGSTLYAAAIKKAHPCALQISDRFHILKGLTDKVKGISQVQLSKIVELYPQLLAVYDLISSFKSILATRHVDNLESWLESAKSLCSPDVNSFVNGISRDIDAVRNAIIFCYSNGLAEGSINKIKRIKHTMYGRASFSSLRTKTLMYEFWKSVN